MKKSVKAIESKVKHRAHTHSLANAVTILSMRAFAKWIVVGSVWGKMSRYLNYGKSFIIAIITNANFRHFFFVVVAFSLCCTVCLLSSLFIFRDIRDGDVFTLLFFLVCLVSRVLTAHCFVYVANVSNTFPIAMSTMCFTCAYLPIFFPLCFYFFFVSFSSIFPFLCRHLFIFWFHFIFTLQFFFVCEIILPKKHLKFI